MRLLYILKSEYTGVYAGQRTKLVMLILFVFNNMSPPGRLFGSGCQSDVTDIDPTIDDGSNHPTVAINDIDCHEASYGRIAASRHLSSIALPIILFVDEHYGLGGHPRQS